jgi:hypothetical protein
MHGLFRSVNESCFTFFFRQGLALSAPVYTCHDDNQPNCLKPGNTKGGSITVPLTSCLESAVCQVTIFCFYLQNRLFQTSKTGGKQYSDTSPFSFPCLKL